VMLYQLSYAPVKFLKADAFRTARPVLFY
jgi:hypothetical protein